MAYDLPPTNMTSISDVLPYVGQQVPALYPGILLLIFVVILSTGFFSQERRRGDGSITMWLAVSGLVTSTISFLFFLTGLINTYTLGICVALTVIFAMFYMLNGNS